MSGSSNFLELTAPPPLTTARRALLAFLLATLTARDLSAVVLHRDTFLAMVSLLHGMVKCAMQMINALHVYGLFSIFSVGIKTLEEALTAFQAQVLGRLGPARPRL